MTKRWARRYQDRVRFFSMHPGNFLFVCLFVCLFVYLFSSITQVGQIHLVSFSFVFVCLFVCLCFFYSTRYIQIHMHIHTYTHMYIHVV